MLTSRLSRPVRRRAAAALPSPGTTTSVSHEREEKETTASPSPSPSFSSTPSSSPATCELLFFHLFNKRLQDALSVLSTTTQTSTARSSDEQTSAPPQSETTVELANSFENNKNIIIEVLPLVPQQQQRSSYSSNNSSNSSVTAASSSLAIRSGALQLPRLRADFFASSSNNRADESDAVAMALSSASAVHDVIEQLSLKLLFNHNKNKNNIVTMIPQLLQWLKQTGDALLAASSGQVSPSLLISDSFVSLLANEMSASSSSLPATTTTETMVMRWMSLLHVEQLGYLWRAVSQAAQQKQQNKKNSVTSSKHDGDEVDHHFKTVLDHVALEAAQRVKKTMNQHQAGGGNNNNNNRRQHHHHHQQQQQHNSAMLLSDVAVGRRIFAVLSPSLIAPAAGHLCSSIVSASSSPDITKNNNKNFNLNNQKLLKDQRFHVNKLLSCMKHAGTEADVWPVLDAVHDYLLSAPDAAAFALQSLAPCTEIWKEPPSAKFVSEVVSLISCCMNAAAASASASSTSSSENATKKKYEDETTTNSSMTNNTKFVDPAAGAGAAVAASSSSPSPSASASSSSPQQQTTAKTGEVEGAAAVRLYIGVRNGAKILHVAKEYPALASFYDSSRTNGTCDFLKSWHVADALLHIGRPFDASRAIDDFFNSTRQLFLERLPRAIQSAVYGIATELGRVGNVHDAVSLLEASRRWDMPTLRPANMLRSILQGAETVLSPSSTATMTTAFLTSSSSPSFGSNNISNRVDDQHHHQHDASPMMDVRTLMKWAAETPGVMTVPATQIAALRLALAADVRALEADARRKRADDSEHDIFATGEMPDQQPRTTQKEGESATGKHDNGDDDDDPKTSSTTTSHFKDVVSSICAKCISYHTADIQRALFVRAIVAMAANGLHVPAARVLEACTSEERKLIPLSVLHTIRRGVESQLRTGGCYSVMSAAGNSVSSSSSPIQNSSGVTTTTTTTATLLAAEDIEAMEQLLEDIEMWIRIQRQQKRMRGAKTYDVHDAEDQQQLQHQRSTTSNKRQQQNDEEEDEMGEPWKCATCGRMSRASVEACPGCSTLRDRAWQCSECHVLVMESNSPLLERRRRRQKQKLLERRQQYPEEDGDDDHFLLDEDDDGNFNGYEALGKKGDSSCSSNKYCTVCSAPRQRTTTSPTTTTDDNDNTNTASSTYTIAPWQCTSCHNNNTSQHPHFCTRCGKQNPLMPRMHAFTCSKCEFVNDRGMLRPWCARCGSLNEKVDSRRAHLWSCDSCATLVPWIQSKCTGCRADRAVDAAAVSWKVWDCQGCGVINAPWQATCRSCRVPQQQLRQNHQQTREQQKEDENATTTSSSTPEERREEDHQQIDSSASLLSAGAKCKTCGHVALADLSKKGHWCEKCGSAMYRRATSSSSSAAALQGVAAEDHDSVSSSSPFAQFWFLPLVTASLRNEPIAKREEEDEDEEIDRHADFFSTSAVTTMSSSSSSGQLDNMTTQQQQQEKQQLQIRRTRTFLSALQKHPAAAVIAGGGGSGSGAATLASLTPKQLQQLYRRQPPLPVEHPLSKDTLMWVCASPSLCLTTNLVTETTCRACGAHRPVNSTSISVSKFKLADDYLLTPPLPTPLHQAAAMGATHLLSAVPSGVPQTSEQQPKNQTVAAAATTQDEDDEDATARVVVSTNDASIAKQLNNTANAMPPFLVRSFAQFCPTCHQQQQQQENENENDGDASSSSSAGGGFWCDARQLSGFCFNCNTFACPLPKPVEFSVSSPASSSTSSSPSSLMPTSTDDDRALRLWAALTLVLNICQETVGAGGATTPDNYSATMNKNKQKVPLSSLVKMFESLVEHFKKTLASTTTSASSATNTTVGSQQHLHHMPWQGFDLTVRAYPDTPTQPIVLCSAAAAVAAAAGAFSDSDASSSSSTSTDISATIIEQPHHALRGLMDSVIFHIVDLFEEAEISTLPSAQSSAADDDDDDDDDGAPLPMDQRFLKCAVDLIEVVNASTEFDELGFSTLLTVARCFHETHPARRDKNKNKMKKNRNRSNDPHKNNDSEWDDSSSSSSSRISPLNRRRPRLEEKPWERHLRVLYLSQMKLSVGDLARNADRCSSCCALLLFDQQEHGAVAVGCDVCQEHHHRHRHQYRQKTKRSNEQEETVHTAAGSAKAAVAQPLSARGERSKKGAL